MQVWSRLRSRRPGWTTWIYAGREAEVDRRHANPGDSQRGRRTSHHSGDGALRGLGSLVLVCIDCRTRSRVHVVAL